MELLFFYFLFCFLILSSSSDNSNPLPSTINRTTKQQIITTLPPSGDPSTSLSFLSSPSGKYTAQFLRRPTAPGAGGFGNDFCYIQVADAASGESMWESDCAPVSTSNACSLVFSDAGLEVFDGSSSAWSAAAGSPDGNPLRTLELVDEGDMRIRDNGGELAWRASDEPRRNQNCGGPGSPGLSQAMPPFAEVVGGGTNMPFGQKGPVMGDQPVADGGDGGRPDAGGRGFGQPLVDNTPYDSGSCKVWVGLGYMFLIGLTCLVCLVLCV